MKQEQNNTENEVTFEISQEALKKRISELIDDRIEVSMNLHQVLSNYMDLLDASYGEKEFSVYDIENMLGKGHAQAKELLSLLEKSGFVRKIESKPKYKIVGYESNNFDVFYENVVENYYRRADEFILSICTAMLIENIARQSKQPTEDGQEVTETEAPSSL